MSGEETRGGEWKWSGERGRWEWEWWGPRVVHRKTNHVFHLLMTVVTGGLWAPVWLAVAATGTRKIKR